MSARERIYLYDTTLRDGAQTQGVDFSVEDKLLIAKMLDGLGLDYVEGGWPGANPTDTAFFAAPPKLGHAKFTAFGMTKRAGRSAENDPDLTAVINSGAGAVCLVGKTWDFHVDVALQIPREENIEAISDSIALVLQRGREALFDAEHFFDGYKANPDYALQCVRAAHVAGARWVVLCDTNGGSLPHEVERIVTEVARHIPGSHLGIHVHNDTENAVANSLAAVRAGVRQVQGTLNGLGERCGNANLVSLIPTLMLKADYADRFETGISPAGLKKLSSVSHTIDEILNRPPNRHAAYVGASAFAHKGGLHVSAMAKNTRTYEHVDPESIGNRRRILVSDQAGKSNLIAELETIGIIADPKDRRLNRLLEIVKQREFLGYSYDGATASFELLVRRLLGEIPEYFRVESYRVSVERRADGNGGMITVSDATAKINIDGENGQRDFGSATMAFAAEKREHPAQACAGGGILLCAGRSRTHAGGRRDRDGSSLWWSPGWAIRLAAGIQ
ncbi:MAG: 2-isopropylmalate synthase [Alphaproteobacteria bacterium]|nr:2-isopropylmalate synthase [Alphaproteobacteria bacterium]